MKGNFKKAVSYLAFIVIFYIIAYKMASYIHYYELLYKSTFERNPYLIYLPIYPIILGLIAGLPSLIKQFKLKGSWKVDWIKLIVIGIPTLYINFSLFLLYSTSTIGHILVPKLITDLYINSNGIVSGISGFIFGYILLNSFKKVEIKEVNIL